MQTKRGWSYDSFRHQLFCTHQRTLNFTYFNYPIWSCSQPGYGRINVQATLANFECSSPLFLVIDIAFNFHPFIFVSIVDSMWDRFVATLVSDKKPLHLLKVFYDKCPSLLKLLFVTFTHAKGLIVIGSVLQFPIQQCHLDWYKMFSLHVWIPNEVIWWRLTFCFIATGCYSGYGCDSLL